jgi:hypothetical protein
MLRWHGQIFSRTAQLAAVGREVADSRGRLRTSTILPVTPAVATVPARQGVNAFCGSFCSKSVTDVLDQLCYRCPDPRQLPLHHFLHCLLLSRLSLLPLRPPVQNPPVLPFFLCYLCDLLFKIPLLLSLPVFTCHFIIFFLTAPGHAFQSMCIRLLTALTGPARQRGSPFPWCLEAMPSCAIVCPLWKRPTV